MGRSILPPGLAHRIANALYRAAGSPELRIRLWTGDEVGTSPDTSAGTLVIRSPLALIRLAIDPELELGDLFVQERIEVEGALDEFLAALLRREPRVGVSHWIPDSLRELALNTGRSKATQNASHHYDVGNEFYACWLDAGMTYTCGYFPRPDASLEEAQFAKMDHVCRKLGLRPGDEVVEAGCGWGGLALHMARHYGARVRACNVAEEQVAYARERAEKEGLTDRVEFIHDDYRNLHGQYDVFASVGMLEHVGTDHYEELGSVIDRCLRPHGLGLLHTIGRSRPQLLNRWMRKRVFPNAHPPTLGEMMRILEPKNFALLDAENLRIHYRLTASHWLRRFERETDRIEALVGRELARTWRFYLAGTTASFETATVQLFQVLFSRAGNDHIPFTREHQYSGDAPCFADEAIEELLQEGGALGER
ncbi:MAG: class I SAM-dependent methyltransferase [bacterium]|nr:class I SAM-dependent methyltransferase [bacterium]